MRDIQHYLRPGTLQLTSLPPLSLYVHLPWCLKKCPYCDFNSHEMRREDMPEQRYLDALLADLEAALPLIWGRSVHSIFHGRRYAQPVFSPASIDRLLADIRARMKLAGRLRDHAGSQSRHLREGPFPCVSRRPG
jgi:coproporphyrinogen III oxidase-like Fe-S oxidoreductase